MDLNALTASKIKELRHSLGYTVEAMARDLGISKTAYSQMENGHVEITLARIEKIANICNISIAEIIPANSSNQVTNGNGWSNNSTNTVNNFFADTQEKLQAIIDSLNATMASVKDAKK